MTGASDDLAPLMGPQPVPGMRYGQGVLRSYNPDTGENTVEWNGLTLEDLPLRPGASLGLQVGQPVSISGWDARGRRGVMQWWIDGRLVIPGGTEFANPIPEEFSVGTLNADTVNADLINVDGVALEDYIQALITAQIPESDPEPPPGGSVKMSKTYNASWSALYQGDNSRNTFLSGLAQGYYSGTNGNQRSLIGFPTSTIQSDLAAATSVTNVSVYIYFDHWFNNSGGTGIIGHHGHTSAPSTFSASTNNVQVAGWPNPGSRWLKYNVGSNLDWKTGARTGIALGPGPSTSRLYYGRARAHNETYPPRLQITWEEPE